MGSIVITMLPCGCLVERSTGLRKQYGKLECPWCAATFSQRQFAKWSKTRHGVLTVNRPVVLVRVGERLLEVTGVCDCDTLLVRERAGAKSFHLKAIPADVEFLTN